MNKPKLLVVDDEDEIRSVIKFFVSDQFDVVQAKDGQEALDIFKSQKIEIILSDFNMPRLNGLELLKNLVELNFCIPVIWLTGQGSRELRRDSWALGVYDYLEKPFKPDELKQCLTGALNFKIPFSGISKMRGLSQELFDFPQLALGIGTYRELQNLCHEKGLAPSTLIDEILSDYLKKAGHAA